MKSVWLKGFYFNSLTMLMRTLTIKTNMMSGIIMSIIALMSSGVTICFSPQNIGRWKEK